jgi:hypothetical protein
VRLVVAALTVSLLLAACGGSGGRRGAPAEWEANADGVVKQLRGDVVDISAVDSVTAARRALRDDSQLYAILIVFSDVGGCNHMVAALGTAPPARAKAVPQLAAACAHLGQASKLFTRAVARTSPTVLVAAAHEALASLPPLDRAALELHRG